MVFGRNDSLILDLAQDGELLAQGLLDVFGLVFPHQPVGSVGAQQSQQGGALVVGDAFERLQLADKFGLKLGFHLVNM